MCRYGQGVVRGLFEELNGDNIRGFAVWLPMMPGDGVSAADEEAATFKDLPLSHAWDPERRLGDLFSRLLDLKATAWDVYFLYAPGVIWEGELPPRPTFWMHQLPQDVGTDWRLQLNAGTFSRELLGLLGVPDGADRADLGLMMHAKGLLNLAGERGLHSLDDIKRAFEGPQG